MTNQTDLDKPTTLLDILKLLRESNLIEGYDDPEFDAQAKVAWEYLEDVALDQLDDHCIQRVQKILTLKQDDLQPDWRGYYRKIPVYIGGSEAVPYWLIQEHMTAWLHRTREANWQDSKEAHVKFEKIHPFVDGNGRTGRILMWWYEQKTGKPLTQITNADKQNYYKWFKENL